MMFGLGWGRAKYNPYAGLQLLLHTYPCIAEATLNTRSLLGQTFRKKVLSHLDGHRGPYKTLCTTAGVNYHSRRLQFWRANPPLICRRTPTQESKPGHHLLYYTSKRRKMSAVSEGIVVGFGNPLLDITIVTDVQMLKKYDLKANNAILAEEKHRGLFKELTQYNPEYGAGGATQNSIRVAQWLLEKPFATTFFGGVGNDQNGQILADRARKDGVNVCYQISDDLNTGVCAALITGEDRSLVAELGAAMKFSHTFLQQPENWKHVEAGKVYYMGGFPFPVSPKSVKLIAEHACANNKLLVMNLSAPYLCKYFVDPEIDIMPYVDVLFGNETEAATFCKLAGIDCTNLGDMALAVSKLPKKNPARHRTVIFTQGKEPTIVSSEGRLITWPINPIPKELIKDTNGCGDAFVGGFLSQVVQEKPLEDCLRCGNYAARTVIQHYGCTYPAKSDFK